MRRRAFIKVISVSGGGLAIGVGSWSRDLEAVSLDQEGRFEPNAYLSISRDNTVTIRIYKHEMGQGVATGLAMIVAEELGADWAAIKTEFMPLDARTPPDADFETGGSSTVVGLWQPLREAGAAAREMLVAAASARWQVERAGCEVAGGAVIHRATRARLTFGELAAEAARVSVPRDIPLKNPRAYTLIGKPTGSRQAGQIVRGQLRYGIDVVVPGMLHAAIVRAPVVGATAVRIDAAPALAISGVRHVLKVPGHGRNGFYAYGVTEGVAVLANTTWAAFQGKRALRVEWEAGANGARDDASLRAQFESAAPEPMTEKEVRGNPDEALQRGRKRLSATYAHPYLAHALMEPLNAIAHVQGDRCELWAGSQSPRRTSVYVADILGIALPNVVFHALPSGGGFGRRFFADYVAEAALLSQQLQRPVKVTWTREDEIRHGRYHPAQQTGYEAALDERNEISGWVAKALTTHGEWRPGTVPLYGIPHARTSYRNLDSVLNWGSWRSVLDHSNVLGNEGFVDEIACSLGEDPLEFRLRHLRREQSSIGDSKEPSAAQRRTILARYFQVLDVLRDHSAWGQSLPAGHGRGIAISHHWSGAVCGHVAMVSVDEGRLRVGKITCAFHCGTIVNPSSVRAQIEGSILWALNPILHGGVTIRQGRVRESNFHDHPLIRMSGAPAIEAHLIESDDPPSGVGEPVVPPLAPAVLNAIFAACGKRLRRLPVTAADLAPIPSTANTVE